MKSLNKNAEDKSVLSRGSNKILRLFICFLCLGMVIAAIKTPRNVKDMLFVCFYNCTIFSGSYP